jgi:hypothetical protein
MSRPRASTLSIALALLVALHAPVARGEQRRCCGHDRGPRVGGLQRVRTRNGPAPKQGPRLWDRGGFNFSSAMLGQKPARAVELCVRVDANGQVSEVRASRGDTPFDSAAVDAVRWWWFVPASTAGKPVPSWTRLSVDIQPPADTEPLVPDVVALALDAESRGDLRGAIELWGGVLARVGVHPSLGDEWSVRERILRLAARCPSRCRCPRPPMAPLAAHAT